VLNRSSRLRVIKLVRRSIAPSLHSINVATMADEYDESADYADDFIVDDEVKQEEIATERDVSAGIQHATAGDESASNDS
jgi:hypothetical protein